MSKLTPSSLFSCSRYGRVKITALDASINSEVRMGVGREGEGGDKGDERGWDTGGGRKGKWEEEKDEYGKVFEKRRKVER